MIKITTPINTEEIRKLKCGDSISLSGVLYTARDAAHKLMVESINEGRELPFDIANQGIYYVGPTPTKPGEIIGSAGPTTSYRMDDLTLPLLERNLKIMIGKGRRDKKVIDGMIKYGAVYLAAIGGAGAYISNSIKSCEVIAYDYLGAEAIRKIEVEDLKLVVAIDSFGKSIYK